MWRPRLPRLWLTLAVLGAFSIASSPASASIRGAISAPSSRAFMGLADDPAAGHVVLFGGWDGTTVVFGDTWTWDGVEWTEQDPATSPAPRCCFQMGYDAARRQVVLFGGTDLGGTYFTDTWTWDGTTWSEREPLNSPPVYLCCDGGMAFDAATRGLVMWSYNKTWVWNGTNWTERRLHDSPPYRYFPGVARDGDHVLLFGGDNGFEDFHRYHDTWRWSGSAWTELEPAQHPSARTELGMAYDQARQRTVLFGGSSRVAYLDDTWTWDGATWTLMSPATSPPRRSAMGMAYDGARRQVVVFGGRFFAHDGLQYLGDTWTWDGTTWSEH